MRIGIPHQCALRRHINAHCPLRPSFEGATPPTYPSLPPPTYPSQPLLSSPQPSLRQCFVPLCARFVAKASLFRRKAASLGAKGRKESLAYTRLKYGVGSLQTWRRVMSIPWKGRREPYRGIAPTLPWYCSDPTEVLLRPYRGIASTIPRYWLEHTGVFADSKEAFGA